MTVPLCDFATMWKMLSSCTIDIATANLADGRILIAVEIPSKEIIPDVILLTFNSYGKLIKMETRRSSDQTPIPPPEPKIGILPGWSPAAGIE